MPSQTRSIKCKIFRLSRSDSSTPKCTIPKGAIITRITAYCDTATDGGTPRYNLNWTGGASNTDIFFSVRGQVIPSGTAGIMIGAPMTADRKILSTFGASGSTTGATGFGIIEYIPLRDGELIDA